MVHLGIGATIRLNGQLEKSHGRAKRYMRYLTIFFSLACILCAAAMVFASFHSIAFWVFWLLGGIIGFLGRLTARRFYAASSMGARLDTWVSVTCVVAMIAVMAGEGGLPGWLWCCLFFAGALRVFAYAICFSRLHSFVPLRAITNEVAELLLFLFPLFSIVLGAYGAGALVCVSVFLSSIEEIVIAKGLSRRRMPLPVAVKGKTRR